MSDRDRVWNAIIEQFGKYGHVRRSELPRVENRNLDDLIDNLQEDGWLGAEADGIIDSGEKTRQFLGPVAVTRR